MEDLEQGAEVSNKVKGQDLHKIENAQIYQN
jgi:hypothetical protein